MDHETEARWQRVIIEENPAFARFMGVRFTSGSRDRIEADLTVGEELASSRNGVIHGGAIMAFADIRGSRERAQSAERRTNDHDREHDQLLPSGPARRDGPRGLHPAKTA